MPNDESSAARGSKALTKDVQSTASALIAATALVRMSYRYIDSLNRLVFFDEDQAPELDLKATIAAQNKLRTEFAREVLTFVWKESSFVSADAMKVAGLDRQFEDGKVSKNGLAKKICNVSEIADLDRFNAIRTDIGRISNAAEAFGLLQHDHISENARPLAATEKLNELMMDCHFTNAKFMNELVVVEIGAEVLCSERPKR